ncbi:hypothetical protein EV702DRAFT_1042036 [Suillus placidus]|uniref:Citrate transporter-like domain-containing protein n=1 Tax=Suillus placidus TaxID=48579 RepID=A0A9P7A313_9AGAM|nr:hypothetical protein EV702DRAFT_1042036 [Suillus placidus]
MTYMAITIDITGILQSAAFWVSNKGGSNGWKLYTYFYVMLTLLSILLGNDSVILSGTVFLVYYAKVAELNHISWVMSGFAAANIASMVLFVGNPTNVVICEGFGVNNAAFTAYTIFPFIACSVSCFFALGGQYRDKKYIPRRLYHTADLDARSVLLDPIGALVGIFMLGSALIMCLVVSFFGIDVWKISLPFAAAKFIYDIAWDHYRFVRQIPMLGREQKGPEENGVQLYDEGAQTISDNKSQYRQSPYPTHTTAKVNSFTDFIRAAINKSPQPSSKGIALHRQLYAHFPTVFTALPRIPFALIPFAFSQFILIEALSHQGWIDVFGVWLLRATYGDMYRTIWLIGVLGVILCNFSGTNIGATILLTKVVRAASPMLTDQTIRAAAIALAVSSNIGAVSFTFSASLAGLLWKSILKQKGIIVTQPTFAYWNALPLVVMAVAGLSVVCAEMAFLY